MAGVMMSMLRMAVALSLDGGGSSGCLFQKHQSHDVRAETKPAACLDEHEMQMVLSAIDYGTTAPDFAIEPGNFFTQLLCTGT